MSAGIGEPWTNFVALAAHSHRQPLHWRLLDGAELSVCGSARRWRARLVPRQVPGSEPAGFELLLVSDEPPLGTANFRSWVAAEGERLGRGYVSELARNFRPYDPL